MINDSEKAVLEQVRDREADIYAEVLALVLLRLPTATVNGGPAMLQAPDPQTIPDLIVGAFTDLNLRAIE
jgi:hypothetical protein